MVPEQKRDLGLWQHGTRFSVGRQSARVQQPWHARSNNLADKDK
jgi:hypothetical protein